MKKEKYIELLIQSVLIVFSVLLALFLNEFRQYQRQEAQKKEMLVNLHEELKTNIKAIEQVKDQHQRLSRALYHYLENDSLQAVFEEKTALYIFGKLVQKGQKFDPAMLQSTAWQLAQQTNQVIQFDYEIQYEFSWVYNLQVRGVERTWESIAQMITSPMMHDKKQVKIAIRILSSSLLELYSQERYLLQKYQALDEVLEKGT